MAVTYTTAMKTARITATRDNVANGTLEILHSDGTTVLATFGLDATAGTISGAVWTLVFDASTVVASASGTATTARIKTSGGTANITGLTCGAGSGDVNLNTVTIGSGANVTLSSATITHA